MQFTAPWDMNRAPTLTLPNGWSDEGLPMALQLVGPLGSEAALCRAGYAYEQATDFTASPGGLSFGHAASADSTSWADPRRVDEPALPPPLGAASAGRPRSTPLAGRGLRLQAGTIVDASIIAAPSSTKNQRRRRDPEMHQTKKGNEWHFGMKLHIGVDAATGVTHSLTEAHRLLRGGEREAWGDAGSRARRGVPRLGGRVAGRDASRTPPAAGAAQPTRPARA